MKGQTEEQFKQWLQSFEAMVGEPIVISLVIDHQKIKFYSMVSKERHDDYNNPDPDDKPSTELKDVKTGFNLNYVR